MDSLFLGKTDAFSLIGDRCIQFVVLFRCVLWFFVMGYCSETIPNQKPKHAKPKPGYRFVMVWLGGCFTSVYF